MSLLQHLIDRGTRTLAASARLVARPEHLDLEEFVEWEPEPAEPVATASLPRPGIVTRPPATQAMRTRGEHLPRQDSGVPGEPAGTHIPDPVLWREMVAGEPPQPPAVAMPKESPAPASVGFGRTEATVAPKFSPPASPEQSIPKPPMAKASMAKASMAKPPMPDPSAGPSSPETLWRGAGIRSIESVAPALPADPVVPQASPATARPGPVTIDAVAASPRRDTASLSQQRAALRELGERLLASHPPATEPLWPLPHVPHAAAPQERPQETADADFVVESLEVHVVAPQPGAAGPAARRRPADGSPETLAGAWDPAVRHYVERW